MDKKISFCITELQQRYGDKEALRIAKEIGADAVDFCVLIYDNTVYTKSDEEIVAYFRDLKEYADGLGLKIWQTHGRLEGFFNDAKKDEQLIKNTRLDLLATSALGAEICVVHPVSTAAFGNNDNAELYRTLNDEMYFQMLPYAREYGVKIAMETFGDYPPLGICEFYAYFDEFANAYKRICDAGYSDVFTICMDTGHTQRGIRFGEPSVAEWIRALGKGIGALHIHDNDGVRDQHKLPCTGTIPWDEVMDALDEVGYEGTYNLECVLTHFGRELMIEEAAFAIKVLRNLLEQCERRKIKRVDKK